MKAGFPCVPNTKHVLKSYHTQQLREINFKDDSGLQQLLHTVFPQDMDVTQCYCVCANAISGLPDYLLLPAPLLPVLLLPLLDLPDDFEEKSLVMNSETSGNSWLEFSIFIDCSISCGKTKHIDMKGRGIFQVTQQLTIPLRKEERTVKGTGSEQ